MISICFVFSFTFTGVFSGDGSKSCLSSHKCVWESALRSGGCQPGGRGQMQDSDLQAVPVALQGRTAGREVRARCFGPRIDAACSDLLNHCARSQELLLALAIPCPAMDVSTKQKMFKADSLRCSPANMAWLELQRN